MVTAGWRELRTSSRKMPGTPLNILQPTRQSPTTKTYWPKMSKALWLQNLALGLCTSLITCLFMGHLWVLTLCPMLHLAHYNGIVVSMPLFPLHHYELQDKNRTGLSVHHPSSTIHWYKAHSSCWISRWMDGWLYTLNDCVPHSDLLNKRRHFILKSSHSENPTKQQGGDNPAVLKKPNAQRSTWP